MLEDDSERLSDEVMFVVMLAFTELSELSTLEEEFETLIELVLIAKSAASVLEDELERFRLEVWLVEILALTELSELSMLDEEFEIEFELVLIAPSN